MKSDAKCGEGRGGGGKLCERNSKAKEQKGACVCGWGKGGVFVCPPTNLLKCVVVL